MSTTATTTTASTAHGWKENDLITVNGVLMRVESVTSESSCVLGPVSWWRRMVWRIAGWWRFITRFWRKS